MKSKGYTSLDIIIIIVFLGIAALLTIPRMSLAFKDDRDELYQNQINLYLSQAKRYGQDHVDELEDHDNTITMTIDELIEEGYIGSYVDKKLYDIRDYETIMNNIKIKITYNEDTEEVKTELA